MGLGEFKTRLNAFRKKHLTKIYQQRRKEKQIQKTLVYLFFEVTLKPNISYLLLLSHKILTRVMFTVVCLGQESFDSPPIYQSTLNALF